MDLLDRLLEHDAWTTRLLMERCRHLSSAELDREFDLGLRTLRKTFAHIVRNVDAWSALMAGDQMPASRGTECTIEELLDWHAVATAQLTRVAREIAGRNGWDEEWLDMMDEPPSLKSYGGATLHVITHSMHHRGQAIHIMKRLGVEDVPEGDVLSWEAWRKANGPTSG